MIALVFIAISAIAAYRPVSKLVRCKMMTASSTLDGDAASDCNSDATAPSALAHDSGPASATASVGGGPAASVVCVGGVCTTPGNCFVAGTLVVTAEGPQPIESIVPGTSVLASDGEGRAAWKPVLRTFLRPTTQLLRLETDDDEALELTPDHRLFVAGRGWTVAREIVPGRDSLVDSDGALVLVRSGESIARDTTVFNLEVADFHSYFVGPRQLLAHNECDDKKTVIPSVTSPVAAVPGDAVRQPSEPTPQLASAAGDPSEQTTPEKPTLRNRQPVERPVLKDNKATASRAPIETGGNGNGQPPNQPVAVSPLPDNESLRLGEVREISPSRVRFSQNSHSDRFKSGGRVDDLSRRLEQGANPDIPPLRVVQDTEHPGEYVTLDNRRLTTYAQAGRKVRVTLATPEETKREVWKLTTTPEQGHGRYNGIKPSSQTLGEINRERELQGLPPWTQDDIPIVGDPRYKGPYNRH